MINVQLLKKRAISCCIRAMLITSGLFVFSGTMVAQTEKAQQTFRFVYVAPDRRVDKKTLLGEIEKAKQIAETNGDPAIFYLARGERPIIVSLNTGANNQEDYDKIVNEISNNTSWTVEASYDRKEVRQLIDESGFLDAEGNLCYERYEISFHVGNMFWDRKRNESVIGALFFDINAAKYINNNAFQFYVYLYCPPAEDNKCDREKPFGILNPDDINSNIKVQRKQKN